MARKKVTKKWYKANSLDAYIPEMWAEAGLMQLQENMVAANLVHRDYQQMFQKFGDIVNVQRPREFTAVRKAKTSDITIQDAIGDNVQVPLNQHIHTSFMIHDVDSSKAFKELHDEFIVPAARSLARACDLVVLGQAYRFRANMGGSLAAAISRAAILQTREKLVVNKAPNEGRNLILCPAQETTLLGIAEFADFDKTGSTEALREASLGRRLGLDLYTCQNMPQVLASSQPATTVGAINNTGGYAAGTTVFTVDGFTGDVVPVGAYVVIAGDNRPRRVTAKTASPNTTSITIATPISSAVADDAVVTRYGSALVNLAAGYAAGFEEAIVYDTITSGKVPQVGQLVSFGSAAAEYTVIAVTALTATTGNITLDRPLDAAVADDAVINMGPTGAFGFCFHKNALAFVVRPLAVPKGGGAIAAMADDPRIGASVRVVMAYDARKQATIVTMDFLAGIVTLDTALGALLVSSDTANS